MPTEREIKLPLPPTLDGIRAKLRKLAYRVSSKRALEVNVLFDTGDAALNSRGELLRVRTLGTATVLTYKGRPKPGKHKNREELETHVDNPKAFVEILERLGFQPGFRYEKFRTEYVKTGEPGTIMLDETPIGNYLEIEGGARWIDQTARVLGFANSDYITVSYAGLYLEYCQDRGIAPGNMVFGRKKNT